MKLLTIKQPWASLICLGIKDVENRTWKQNCLIDERTSGTGTCFHQ